MDSNSPVDSANSFPVYSITPKEQDIIRAIENGTAQDLGISVSPEAAQQTLLGLGYKPAEWQTVVSRRIGSHETRSLAIIALGDQVRIKNILHANLRAVESIESGISLSAVVGIELVLMDETMQTEASKLAKQTIDTTA